MVRTKRQIMLLTRSMNAKRRRVTQSSQREQCNILMIPMACVLHMFEFLFRPVKMYPSSGFRHNNKLFDTFNTTCKIWYNARKQYLRVLKLSFSSALTIDDLRHLKLSDMELLASIPHLTELKFRNNVYEDMDMFSNLRKFTCDGVIEAKWPPNLTSLTMGSGVFPKKFVVNDFNNVNTNYHVVYPCLQELILYSASRLPNLSMFESLEIVVLCRYFDEVLTLDILSKLQNLPMLSMLSFGNVSDLSAISQLTTLKSLKCFDSSFATLDPISNLTRLEMLHISAPNLVCIKAVSNFPRLEVLRLPNCFSLEDISPCFMLTNLYALDIENCTELMSLSFLDGIVGLKELQCNFAGILRSQNYSTYHEKYSHVFVPHFSSQMFRKRSYSKELV